MKFSKKDFKKKYKPKTKVKEEEVDESLYGLEPGKYHYSHLEIHTDTQEIPGDTSSDFETDIPIDTDKKKVNTMNVGADAARGGNMGVRYGNANEGVDEVANDNMKAMVQELLRKRTKENDIVPTNQYDDVDSDKNLELSQKISDLNLISKTNELLKVLNNTSKEDVEIVINHLNANIKQNV